jgi:hypothetical protein
MKKKRDRQTVALPSHVTEKARELSSLASQHGWSAFGVKRDDPATITAIFEEAINLLAARFKGKGGK